MNTKVPTSKPRSVARVVRLAAAVALVVGADASAATAVWNNIGTDFNTGTNWAGGTGLDGIPGTGDNATFNAATPTFQPELSASLTIQGLTYSTSGWLLSSANGSLLSLTNVGTLVASAINATNATGTDTISAGLVLAGAAASTATFTQARGGTLVLSGPITSTNVITGLSLSGAGAGSSTFTLSGSNSYSGNTTIGAANIVVNVNSTTALSSGALAANNSVTLDNTSATAALVLSNNNNINLSGGSLTYTGTAGNSLSFGTGVVTASVLNRSITVNGGTLTIGSLNTDTIARTILKGGVNGTLVITGAAGSNFQGGYTTGSGTTLIGDKASLGTGAISFGGSALQASTPLTGSANKLANVISLTGTGTVSGNNSIEFGGKLTGIAGGSRTLTSSIIGGTLTLNDVDLNSDAGTVRTLTINGAGSTNINGLISSGPGLATHSLILTSTAGVTTFNNAGSTFSGGVNINNAGSTLAFGADSTPSASGSTVTSGPIGTGALTIGNAGTLTAANGARTIANTILFNNVSGTIGGSNNLTLNGAVTWGGSNTITFTNQGLTTFGGPGFTLRNGTGTSPQAQRTLTLAGAGTSVFATPLVNGFTVNGIVTLAGTGLTTFSGDNSYSGLTSVNAGTLRLGSPTALGFGGVSVVAGTTNIASGATIDLNGQASVNERITLNGTGVNANGNLISDNTGAVASVGSGVSALAVTTSGAGYSTAPLVTITGAGAGATAVATLGLTPESFTLNPGDKVYSTAPTVTITGGGGQGAFATAVLSGGTVVGLTITTDARGTAYTSAPTITFSGGTATSGTVDPTGTGNASNFTVTALQITAPGTGYTGTPTVSFDSGAAAATAIASGLLLNGTSDNSIGGAGDILVSGTINGGALNPLTKVGPGTLTIAGNAPYLGATNVNTGTLRVNGTLGTSLVSVASGATLSGTGSVASVNIAPLAFLQGGDGLTPSGALSSGGIVSLSDGAVIRLTLGTGDTHSSLSRTGGTWGFDPTAQAFLFNSGAQPGNYLGIITGLTGSETGLDDIGNWTLNAQYAGSVFVYDGAGSVNLFLIPEPGAALSLLSGIGMLLALRPRRRDS